MESPEEIIQGLRSDVALMKKDIKFIYNSIDKALDSKRFTTTTGIALLALLISTVALVVFATQ